MKRPLHFCIILLSLFMIHTACTHEAFTPPDCVDLLLERTGMIRYTGQELNCNTNYFGQYEWKSENYFEWGNPCIDMIPMPVDCEGNALVDSIGDPVLGEYFREATPLGIVGIQIK